jgi:hypothetical protein
MCCGNPAAVNPHPCVYTPVCGAVPLQPAPMHITAAPCLQRQTCPYPCVEWQMFSSKSAAAMHVKVNPCTLSPISASSNLYLVLMKQTQHPGLPTVAAASAGTCAACLSGWLTNNKLMLRMKPQTRHKGREIVYCYPLPTLQCCCSFVSLAEIAGRQPHNLYNHRTRIRQHLTRTTAPSDAVGVVSWALAFYGTGGLTKLCSVVQHRVMLETGCNVAEHSFFLGWRCCCPAAAAAYSC